MQVTQSIHSNILYIYSIDAQNKTNTTTLASYRAFCITIPYFYNHDDIDADNTYINYYADTIRGRNRPIHTTTATYSDCGRTINTPCYMNDNDDIHTCTSSPTSSSSSSRLFIDILHPVFLRGISCRLDNHYSGHNSHLLLLYKRKRKNVCIAV